MKKLYFKVCTLVFLIIPAENLLADWKTDTGDVLQIALPLSALGGTYIADDEEGRWMLVKGFALNTATVHTTKFAVDKWRPAGQNGDSFPSGHTAAAFGGASFIQTRYGYSYGVPAYALATFVGYSRIISENHYADDVLAGASLAMMSNWAFTEPLIDDVTISASTINGGVKVAANIPLGNESQRSEPVTKLESVEFNPDVRFVFEFGGAWMNKNDIAAPKHSGDVLDFNVVGATADPTSSVRSGFEFFFDKHNELFIQFSPYELRAVGTLNVPTNFNGSSYNTTDETFMAYRWNEYRVRWRYKLIDNRDFVFKLGAGLSISDNQVELSTVSQTELVSTLSALPIGHIHAGMNIGDRSELYVEVDGGGAGDEYIIDTTLQYRYKFNKHWDIGGGYRYQSVRIDTSDMYNHYNAENIVMNLGYSFTY